MSRPSRRGMTLVELLVAMVLLGVLLTGLYSVLVGSVDNYLVGTNSAALEQSATNGLNRVTWELTESDPASVATFASPPGIVFASPRDASGRFQYDSSGALYWQRYICYYVGTVNGSPALIKKEEPLVTPQTTPPTIPGSMNTSYFSTSGALAAEWVDTDVSGFTASGADPVQLVLTASKAPPVPDRAGSGRLDSVQLRTEVTLRN